MRGRRHHHHRWEHYREHYRHAMSPVGWMVRRSLHRRIFVLLGASIALSAVVVMLVFHFTMSTGSPTWRRELDGFREFIGERFERVWDTPAERADLARSMARDLRVDVDLFDPAHVRIGSFGGALCAHPQVEAPVLRGAQKLGSVSICLERLHPGQPWRIAVPLFVFGVVLWGASGRIARRLTRPYSELARVAEEIGAGKLSSRYEIPRRGGADEAVVLGEAINDMAARIEKQMADQRELLAAVSHEIRTPLSRIRLMVELARSGALDGKTLDELDREVTEIDALVGELLASSRLDFAALSPHELDALDVARRALERAGLPESLLDTKARDLALSADPTLLARALANLLDNAKAHGGGADCLRVREEGDRIVFEVEDHGPGFAPGEEQKVFESFYQRPQQEPRAKGSLGLGLTLVKRIAVAHGGTAFAANREGGGARVGIELPRGTESSRRGDATARG